VDDLLIHSPTQGTSNANTVLVLNVLADREYKAQKKKKRPTSLHNLGFIPTPGALRLSTERIEVICGLGMPLTKHQLCSFLGMAVFCRMCIPNFAVLAKPLYETMKGSR
jgi:hypothetical protein